MRVKDIELAIHDLSRFVDSPQIEYMSSSDTLQNIYTFNLQDTVSQPDNARQTAAAVIITAAILILLPMLPGSANLGASNGFNL